MGGGVDEIFLIGSGGHAFDPVIEVPIPSEPKSEAAWDEWEARPAAAFDFGVPGVAAARGATLLGGNGDDYVSGTSRDDTIDGGRDNDDLYGRLGNDILTGGHGKDRFLFTEKPSRKDADRITDFSHRDDTIVLDGLVFTKAGAAGKTIKKGAFWTGTKAHDKDDRIIYDKKSGALYYDPDGTGKAAQAKFATLEKNLNLDHTDFLVLV